MKNQVIKDLAAGNLQPLTDHLKSLLKFSRWDFPSYQVQMEVDPDEPDVPDDWTYWDEFVSCELYDDIVEYLEICGGAVGFSPPDMIVRYQTPFHPQSDPQIDPDRVKADFARLVHQDETFLTTTV